MSSSTTSLTPLATDIEESCRLLGIGKTKLYEEINAGRLRAVKIGAKTLLPTEQFPGWLQSLPSKPKDNLPDFLRNLLRKRKGKPKGKVTARRSRSVPAGGAVS